MQTCPGFFSKSLLESPGNLLEICSVKFVDTLFLNALVDGASTTCCGNAFQQLITLMLKNDFRTVVERRGTNNLFKYPCKLWVSVASWKISDCQFVLFLLESYKSQSDLCEVVFAAVCTVLMLSASLHMAFSLNLEPLFFALCWIRSRHSMSFLNCTQYSRCGLM